VLVTKNTSIEKLDRTYKIPMDDVNATTPLNQLSGMPPFTRVTCEAKVVRLDEPTETASGKILQNVLVADSSGMARVIIWENDINKLEINKSYQFNKMMLREFRGQVQLSIAKDESKMIEIDDLDAVQQNDNLLMSSTIENATIVGVISLEKYSICLKCNGKVTHAEDEFGWNNSFYQVNTLIGLDSKTYSNYVLFKL